MHLPILQLGVFKQHIVWKGTVVQLSRNYDWLSLVVCCYNVILEFLFGEEMMEDIVTDVFALFIATVAW